MMLSYIAYTLSKTPTGSGGGIVVKRGDEILEGPYPPSFMDFVGQRNARLQIMAAITSSAHRDARLDHMLLASGFPGIGKSSLARLTAHLRGVGFVELGGAVTDKDAMKALKEMQDGDVLFLDEIHRLVTGGKARAEWLLTLLQDGVLHMPSGVFQAPDVTVIAATTDAQKLPETILDRFTIKPTLVPYTTAEATEIATLHATRLGFGKTKPNLPMPEETEWLSAIAKACDNNPRRIGQLLAIVRDIALSTELDNLLPDGTGYDLDLALEWAGLTPDGLTSGMQDYLVALFVYGGKAGIGTLKASLNETDVSHTEKGLIQKGYVIVASGGRELTDFGRERALELAHQQVAAAEAREKETA
jgi:Holliday junction DNA helicase RuvB